MAIQRDKLFTGVAGNVVFFNFNGKQGFRTRPRRVKQTKGMKTNSNRFGQAARISAAVRSGLNKILTDTKEKKMRYRFNHTIAKWLQHNSGIAGNEISGFATIESFQFNEKAPLSEKLNQLPVVDWHMPGEIIINIPSLVPARDIAAPPGTTTIRWQVAAVKCEMNQYGSLIEDAVTIETDMTYDQHELLPQKIVLPLTAENDHLTIVALPLKYYKGAIDHVEDERWKPAAIIATHYR